MYVTESICRLFNPYEAFTTGELSKPIEVEGVVDDFPLPRQDQAEGVQQILHRALMPHNTGRAVAAAAQPIP